MRPDVDEFGFVVQGGMVKVGEQITLVEDEDAVKTEVFRDVSFLSSFDRYYATIFYNLNPMQTVIIEGDRFDNPMIFVEGLNSVEFSGYIGPKDYKILSSLNSELVEAIEYGMITLIAKPLFAVLQYLHDLFGNWGWAIVVLTILIRLVLYPLTYKGMISMQKLKEVAPDIKELQRKYKGNPQQMQAKTMELYRKHGANPLGGCLPLLLQLPIFFAIYRVLINAVELQGAEWILWIDDLAKMDPYFILPVLMGISMYWQQHITPNNFTDPMQEKIFKFLPLIFTLFFVTFPAGLTLYWFVNNLLSIAQQYIVNIQFEKHKAKKRAEEQK
jgi:YidC/Oxa1 family membrane protein insertase